MEHIGMYPLDTVKTHMQAPCCWKFVQYMSDVSFLFLLGYSLSTSTSKSFFHVRCFVANLSQRALPSGLEAWRCTDPLERGAKHRGGHRRCN